MSRPIDVEYIRVEVLQMSFYFYDDRNVLNNILYIKILTADHINYTLNDVFFVFLKER
jgi:hypothetical protein